MATSRKSASGQHAPFPLSRAKTLDLLLDDENPRLPPEDRGASQPKLVEIMLERFAIDEIAESICAAGFLPLDPFVAYETSKGLVVLEGNRRLATLKLLLDPGACPKRFADRWDAFRARITPEIRQAIEWIDVYVAASRANADVLSYIGFRHVNGIMPWDAAEKAAYIANLVEKHGWSYQQVAEIIGSKRQFVEKWYIGYRLVAQAQSQHVPGFERMRDQFGVLHRALQAPKIRDFLGVTFPGDPKKSRKPCTRSHRDLEEFVRWTFGTDDHKPVLEDSRDLTKWGTVLESQDAVRYLRTADDPRFDRAYAKSGGLKEGLVDSLQGAADRLEEAIPLIRQNVGDADVQRAVDRCADYFVQILRYFPGIQKEQNIRVQDDRAS